MGMGGAGLGWRILPGMEELDWDGEAGLGVGGAPCVFRHL